MIVPKMRDPSPRARRQRAIENIWRDNEQKKTELHGTFSPKTLRNPMFYLGLVFFLALIGVALINKTDSTVGRKQVSPELLTLRNVEVLAEALGRYRFHTGAYPTLQQGLGALVRNPKPPVLGWDGPYINQLPGDFWGTPFVYVPPQEEGGLPTLFSCGIDRLPGTPDDLKPDPASFDPGIDWTNGWTRAADRLPGVNILKP